MAFEKQVGEEEGAGASKENAVKEAEEEPEPEPEDKVNLCPVGCECSSLIFMDNYSSAYIPNC